MANCHIRIYVACNSQGNPDSSALGHFDIQFDGTYTIDGRSYTNPVFSYGGGNNNPGKLTIFNAARTATVFAGKKFKAYTYNFSTSQNVNTVISNILSYLDTSNEDPVTSNAYTYDVVRGPFSTYTLTARNCFTATATFASWVGYNGLVEIAEAAGTNYQSYSAYNMWKKYGGAWEYHGFYS